MFFEFPRDFRVRKPAPGFTQHLVWGDKMMLSYAPFEPNISVPLHNHPHEQLVMVIQGEFSFTVGDETRLLKPNDVALVPSNAMHCGTSGPQGSVVVDIFSPPREDYKVS